LNSKIVLLFAILITAASAAADNLIMPQELVLFAKKNGCSQVVDFYNVPGMINPPYVYGYLPGDPENSAVFWCQKNESSDKPYLLLFMSKIPDVPIGCPYKIEWGGRIPVGLSIDRNISLPLLNFYYIDNTDKPISKKGVTTGSVVVDYYDGISTYFYCFKGRWAFYTTD